MSFPVIIAHGDLRILYAIFGVLGFALLSGVVSVVAALRKKQGKVAKFAVVSGIVAALLGSGVLYLFGWPGDFSDPFALATLLPPALGVTGILLGVFFKRDEA